MPLCSVVFFLRYFLFITVCFATTAFPSNIVPASDQILTTFLPVLFSYLRIINPTAQDSQCPLCFFFLRYLQANNGRRGNDVSYAIKPD